MRALRYLAFLVAVFAFMAFASFQENLTPDEALALDQFNKLVEREERAQAVASEVPTPGTVVPSTTPVATEPATPVEVIEEKPRPNGYILEDNVNVRRGPGLDYPVVTQLYKWDEAVLGELLNGWYEIFIDGETLYVSDDFAALNPL